MTTDTSLESEDRVLRLTHRFDAPREIIFRAWTDASWLVRWMGPQACSCPFAEIDLRVGGAFRLAIRNAEGKDHVAFGTYQAIESPGQLTFTWQWEQEDGSPGHEMLIEIELRESDAGTDMVFTQTRFPTEDSRDQHQGGWTSSFASLVDVLEEFLKDS